MKVKRTPQPAACWGSSPSRVSLWHALLHHQAQRLSRWPGARGRGAAILAEADQGLERQIHPPPAYLSSG